MANPCKNNKRNGYIYEQLFFARALQQGLEVFTPKGEHLPQDCHVVNQNGTIFRVQIKGTETAANEPGRKYPRYRVSTGQGKNAKTYIDCTKVDFVVCYIGPHDVFYIVPCELITGVSTWFYTNDPKSEHAFEKYRNNWDMLKSA